MTLDEALDLLSRPRSRRARQAAQPLAEVGLDPVSGAPIVVKEGRFGPYVTDGTVNASLRRGDSAEALTVERAAELLAERRARVGAEAAAGGTAKSGARRASKATAGRQTARSPRAGAGSAAKKSSTTKKRAPLRPQPRPRPSLPLRPRPGPRPRPRLEAEAARLRAARQRGPQNPRRPANRQRQNPLPPPRQRNPARQRANSRWERAGRLAKFCPAAVFARAPGGVAENRS